MSLPTKDNPNKYTITTKVNRATQLRLVGLAMTEYEGNVSKLVNDMLEESLRSLDVIGGNMTEMLGGSPSQK